MCLRNEIDANDKLRFNRNIMGCKFNLDDMFVSVLKDLIGT